MTKQTLDEKCSELILQLVRYGKRALPERYQKFVEASEQLESGNAVSISENLIPFIFAWADDIEKKTPNLSRHLSHREEWNTVVKAVAVMDQFINDNPKLKPKRYDDFKRHINEQSSLRESMDQRSLASHARAGGWGRDSDDD